MKHRSNHVAVLLFVVLWYNTASAAPSNLADSLNTPKVDNQSTANPMKLSLTSPWTNVTVQLLVVGTSKPPIKKSESIQTPAKAGTYSVTASGSTKVLRSFFVEAIIDPYTKRFCIARGAWPGQKDLFYVSNSSGIVAYEVGPGTLTWEDSYVSIGEGTGGLDAAIAQFEAKFDDQKLDKILTDSSKNNRISLGVASPHYFFSDGPGPGGAIVGPVLDSVDISDDIMYLVVHNPKTMGSATFWIDLKAKKVTRSVVNGQEMDLSTGQSFAAPVKAN
jgi:hypothetical protein